MKLSDIYGIPSYVGFPWDIDNVDRMQSETAGHLEKIKSKPIGLSHLADYEALSLYGLAKGNEDIYLEMSTVAVGIFRKLHEDYAPIGLGDGNALSILVGPHLLYFLSSCIILNRRSDAVEILECMSGHKGKLAFKPRFTYTMNTLAQVVGGPNLPLMSSPMANWEKEFRSLAKGESCDLEKARRGLYKSETHIGPCSIWHIYPVAISLESGGSEDV